MAVCFFSLLVHNCIQVTMLFKRGCAPEACTQAVAVHSGCDN